MGILKTEYPCALTMAMDLVGGKWKMVMLWHLRHGVLRFSELKRLLPGITQKMFTQQLRELEESGLIFRTVYPVVPPKVEYGLSEEGHALVPSLVKLCSWGNDYAKTHGIRNGCPPNSGS